MPSSVTNLSFREDSFHIMFVNLQKIIHVFVTLCDRICDSRVRCKCSIRAVANAPVGPAMTGPIIEPVLFCVC